MYLNNIVDKANKKILNYSEPLDYLRKRGLNLDDIQKYKIGFAKFITMTDDGSISYKVFKESTYGFKALQNRLIFPLHNILGKVNGVVVRDIHQKKYIQYLLPEAKNIGAFFGLSEALPHIFKTKKVFVHEGALDSISFSKIFSNSVSSLTSFLNQAQYETLLMFAEKIILIFDGDESGSYGIKKSIEYYGTKHIDYVNIGRDDTNQYLQRLGEEKFKKYIKSKIPFLMQN